MRQVGITTKRFALLGCLWMASQTIAGCGGEMGQNAPKDDTGAPGTLLDSGAGAGGSSGAQAGAGGQADAAQDAPMDANGLPSNDTSSPSGGATGSDAGVGAGGGVSGQSGSGGGGAAGGPSACEVCERTFCKIAQPTKPKPQGAQKYAPSPYFAYDVCFSSGAWSGNPISCGADFDPTSTVAAKGPAKGKLKTDLCKAALKCIRAAPSKCGDGLDDLEKCYCGTVDTLDCFSGGQQAPNGDCKNALEDANESDDPVTISGLYTNPCGAGGAALDIDTDCDYQCCRPECLGATEPGPFDPAWCLPAGSVGTGGGSGAGGATGSSSSGIAGIGGVTGSTGVAGSGSVGGTGGVGGISGTGGTGSIDGTGGVAGTTGAAGTGNSGGAGGPAGTSGAGGTGGAQGTAGASGSGGAGTAGALGSGGAGTAGALGSGSAGTGGASGSGTAGTGGASGSGSARASLVENYRFLGNTVPWKVTGTNAASNFSVDDAEGTGTTGSLWLGVTMGDSSLTTETAAFQCLPAAPGDTFDVDAAVKVPDATTSRGVVELVAYRSDGCWGPVLQVTVSPQASDPTWGHLKVSAPTPVGAQSVAVQLVTVKLAGHDSAAAVFDSVLATHR